MSFLKKYNLTKDQLEYWYSVELRSYRWIMKQLNLNSGRTIKKLLKEAGIKIRVGSEAVATQWINNDKRRKDIAEFNRINMTGRKLGPCSEDRKRKIGIANRGENNGMFGITGEKHHHFLGGKKSWAKGRNIDPIKKKEIIKQLGGECIRCSSLEKLTINHKIPWRECRHHELWNLEVLCSKCHFSGPNKLR